LNILTTILTTILSFVISFGLALSGVGFKRETANMEELNNENKVAIAKIDVRTPKNTFSAIVSAGDKPIETCYKVKKTTRLQFKFFASAS